MNSQAPAPAGWYRDESKPILRWWDGQRWTDHERPLQAEGPLRPPQTRVGWKGPAIAFIAVMALVGACLPDNTYSDGECDAMAVSIASGDDSSLGDYGNHC